MGRLVETQKINATQTDISIVDTSSLQVIPGLQSDITVELGSVIAINVDFFYTIGLPDDFGGYAYFQCAIELESE